MRDNDDSRTHETSTERNDSESMAEKERNAHLSLPPIGLKIWESI